MTPVEAKREGYRVTLRDDWEDIKLHVMYEVVLAKFSQNEFLKQKLIATGREWLEEGNTWGRQNMGYCKWSWAKPFRTCSHDSPKCSNATRSNRKWRDRSRQLRQRQVERRT